MSNDKPNDVIPVQRNVYYQQYPHRHINPEPVHCFGTWSRDTEAHASHYLVTNMVWVGRSEKPVHGAKVVHDSQVAEAFMVAYRWGLNPENLGIVRALYAVLRPLGYELCPACQGRCTWSSTSGAPCPECDGKGFRHIEVQP
jgi:hypothetical protein